MRWKKKEPGASFSASCHLVWRPDGGFPIKLTLPQDFQDELFPTNIAFPGIRPWDPIGDKLMIALFITKGCDCRHRLDVRSCGKYDAPCLLV